MGAPETFVEFGVLANLYIIPVVLGVAAANIVDKVTGQSKPVYVVAYAQPFSPSPNTGPGTQSIGYKLATATSSNGQSWSDGAIIDASAPANGFIFFTIIGGSLNLNQHQRTVCFGNGVFCLIGGGNAKNSTNLPATWLMGDPAVFTSADGKDWSQNILPNNLPPNRNAFNLTGVNFSKNGQMLLGCTNNTISGWY